MTLKNHHKVFIVTRLACYSSPTEVQEAFSQEYGEKLSLSQIGFYNPSNAQAAKELGEDWKELFNLTRSKYIDDITAVPISIKRYRLDKLQRNMEELERMKNYAGVNDCLEQAAKEVGEVYTNKRDVNLSSFLTYDVLERLSDQQLERIAKGEHPLVVMNTSTQILN